MKLIHKVLCFILWINADALSEERGCSSLPEVENADISEESQKDSYINGELLYFTCRVGYTSTRKLTYRCDNGRWNVVRLTKCLPKPCELPEDTANGRYEIVTGTDLVFGTVIKYTCNEGYQMVSRSPTRSCTSEGWSGHVPLCEVVKCVAEIHDENIVVSGLEDNGSQIQYGHVLNFKCTSSELVLNGDPEVVCLSNGTWSSRFPTCEVPEQVTVPTTHQKIPEGGYFCAPPQSIKYADIKGLPKDTYRHGDRVEYQCQRFYILRGPSEMVCRNGQWTQPPSCLAPCIVTVEEMRQHGVKLKFGMERKLYSVHSDRIQFICQPGKGPRAQEHYEYYSTFIRYCNNGEISIPSCV